MKRYVGMANLRKSPFGKLYDEAQLLPSIRRSLFAMMLGNMCGNLFSAFTSGSALTGYAMALGANDFVFGLLTGIPLAAALMQIPVALLVSRTQKRKCYMLTYGLFSRALWLLIGLVPFFLPPQPYWLRLWSVIFFIGLSSASGSFINVCSVPWMADLIPAGIRGRWMSLRDSIISVIGILVGVGLACLLDAMPGFGGYAVVFLLGGALGVTDMICYAFVQDIHHMPPANAGFAKVTKQICSDKPFFRFMIFWTLWNLTANLSGPYMGRYALGEMGLSFVQLTLSGQIAAALTNALIISFWGRILDRHGSQPVLLITGIAAALTPAFYLFSVPGSVLPTLLHNTIGAAFWCGTTLCATVKQLSCSPNDQRPSYIAFFACITSLGSFVGTLAGGAFLEVVNTLKASGGLMGDRYKVLFALSVISRLTVVLFFVPRLENEPGKPSLKRLKGAHPTHL